MRVKKRNASGSRPCQRQPENRLVRFQAAFIVAAIRIFRLPAHSWAA
ncbi:MAG: hypothetical protein ACFNLD_10760 [Kingella oralis]